MESNSVVSAEIVDGSRNNASVISGNSINVSNSETYYDYSYKLIIKHFIAKRLLLYKDEGIGDWGLGIGDWGLGNGDWGLGTGPRTQPPIPNPLSPIPNPQSPIPNPQSPIPNPH